MDGLSTCAQLYFRVSVDYMTAMWFCSPCTPMKRSIYCGYPMPSLSMFVGHVWEGQITCLIRTQGFRLSGTLLEGVLVETYPGCLNHTWSSFRLPDLNLEPKHDKLQRTASSTPCLLEHSLWGMQPLRKKFNYPAMRKPK